MLLIFLFFVLKMKKKKAQGWKKKFSVFMGYKERGNRVGFDQIFDAFFFFGSWSFLLRSSGGVEVMR